MKRLIALLLVFVTLTASASAETLRVYKISWADKAQARLAEKHPGLRIKTWDGNAATDYLTTAEFAAPLQTRSFDWDVFDLNCSYVDAQLLMEKGFLLDLSFSADVRDIISRLHPSIAAQCVRDGKIYALPLVYPQPLYLEFVDMDNWLAAGYTAADIPSTFSGYLDFIERCIERYEQDPDFEYMIVGFSSDDYNKKSWLHFLTTLFLQQHECQYGYANEPLRFHDPAIIAIMERIEALCDRLWALGPRMASDAYDPPCLFTGFPGWNRLAETRVDLRLSEDQPRLTPMNLTLTAVNAATDKPQLAADFLVAQLMVELELFPNRAAMLFQDAETVRNPDFDEFYTHSLNMIALCEHRLSGDDTPISAYIIPTEDTSYESMAARLLSEEDWQVEQKLDYWRSFSASLLEQEWLISEADLAAYQAIADELYFTRPSIFDMTQETQTSSDMLWNQFCDGLISAREYCEQLDRMAWMMAMENQ